MGWYLRKAFRVGPFRLNLSKSGLGLSAGVKGARVGVGPRGGYLHAGREGLYYRTSLSSRRRSASRRARTPAATPVVLEGFPPLFTALQQNLRSQRRDARLLALLLVGAVLGLFLSPFSVLLLFASAAVSFRLRRRRLRQLEGLPAPSVDLAGSVVVLDGVLEDARLVAGVTFPLSPAAPGVWGFPGGSLRVVGEEFWLVHHGVLSATELDSPVFRPGEALFAALPEGFRSSGTRWRHQRVDGSPDRRFSENPELQIVEVGLLDLGSGLLVLRPR